MILMNAFIKILWLVVRYSVRCTSQPAGDGGPGSKYNKYQGKNYSAGDGRSCEGWPPSR